MKLLGLAVSGVASIAAFTPGLAADPPVAPFPPPALVAPWGGVYIGGFAGGAFSNSRQGYSVESPFIAANFPTVIPQIGADGSQVLRGGGFDLSVRAGYDGDVGHGFVIGVVGDFSASGLQARRRVDSNLLPAFAPLLPYEIKQALSSDWRGSARLRIGASPLASLLVYATGGPALGHFTYKTSFWDRLDPPFYAPANESESVTLHALRFGWTLGGGAEWALNRTWSIAGDYLHWEFGSFGAKGVLPLVQPDSTAYIAHTTGAIRLDTFRIGVNYHFD